MEPTPPGSPRSKRYDDVRVWAGLLAGESRGEGWVENGYAAPEIVLRIARELDTLRGNGLICLIGSQGVGKSSALMALDQGALWGTSRKPDTILIKWRRGEELHTSFLENTRKTLHAYLYRYSVKLYRELELELRRFGLNPEDRNSLEQLDKEIKRFEMEGVKVERVLLQGRPSIVESIVEFAASAHISLIVMGTRGPEDSRS